ncbi:hypothetical protein ABZZ79_15080 [Streptomyces sp. NPDC006458]|uniref:hypothetical protein n=1 Tax=Streptomyces sp. NPDC006458 TaxID=3154302 RepID=UPI0033BDA3A4
MPGSLTRRAAGAAVILILGTAVTACSDDDSPSSTVSEAASAVQSAASKVASAASQAPEALASATAEAGRKLDDIKGGTDVSKDVRLAEPQINSAGRATVGVSAHNSAGSAKSFAVQVNFTDTSGNLLDTVVVTLSDVPSGETGKATATSNRDLSGEVKAEVGRAVRY